jgi:hypothetical protein
MKINPSKHWRFNQIDGTNQLSAKIYIRLILGILFLGHYSSAKMRYAARSLRNALISSTVSYVGITYKNSQNGHKNTISIEITSQYCPFSAQ